jgi:hypothetical protein
VGSAGVIRRSPSGRWAFAFFWISLLEDGLVHIFGDEDRTPEEVEAFLRGVRLRIPPMEEGSIELAADYIWGAYALGEERGIEWPPEADRHLALIPKPPGSHKQWRKRLIGPGPGKSRLTPASLVKVIRENPLPDDLPEGTEIAIFTRMTFRVEDTQAALDRLKQQGESEQDFRFDYAGQEEETEYFDWTREYPEGHWSPAAQWGGRQVLGSLRMHPTAPEGKAGEVTAEVRTLSMAAGLIAQLKELLGDQLTLKETTWKSLQDLLGDSSE